MNRSEVFVPREISHVTTAQEYPRALQVRTFYSKDRTGAQKNADKSIPDIAQAVLEGRLTMEQVLNDIDMEARLSRQTPKLNDKPLPHLRQMLKQNDKPLARKSKDSLPSQQMQMSSSNISNRESINNAPTIKKARLESRPAQTQDFNLKPPFSYVSLIGQAILSSSNHRMTLSEIYDWIATHYPYYKKDKKGWQNSIRHNLSLSKNFERLPRAAGQTGKGCYWTIVSGQENAVEVSSYRERRTGNTERRDLTAHFTITLPPSNLDNPLPD